MFAVDTNILIYAHFDGYPQHARAAQFCRQQLFAQADWCLSWQVIYEYLRITTHPKIHTQPLSANQAFADLEPYINTPHCHVLLHTPRHIVVLSEIFAQMPTLTGNLVHDCHYAALLREHGVKTIYSADSDFKQFNFLEVLDPTTP